MLRTFITSETFLAFLLGIHSEEGVEIEAKGVFLRNRMKILNEFSKYLRTSAF